MTHLTIQWSNNKKNDFSMLSAHKLFFFLSGLELVLGHLSSKSCNSKYEQVLMGGIYTSHPLNSHCH